MTVPNGDQRSQTLAQMTVLTDQILALAAEMALKLKEIQAGGDGHDGSGVARDGADEAGE